MKVKTRKVGNSLSITIPRDVVSEMHLTADTDMNVFVREGAVVLEPTLSEWDRLIARMRAQAAESGVTEQGVLTAIAEVRAQAAAERRAAQSAARQDDAS